MLTLPSCSAVRSRLRQRAAKLRCPRPDLSQVKVEVRSSIAVSTSSSPVKVEVRGPRGAAVGDPEAGAAAALRGRPAEPWRCLRAAPRPRGGEGQGEGPTETEQDQSD